VRACRRGPYVFQFILILLMSVKLENIFARTYYTVDLVLILDHSHESIDRSLSLNKLNKIVTLRTSN
jgi:hypothetical protein